MPNLVITVTVPGASASTHKAVAGDFLQVMREDIQRAVVKALGQTSNVPFDALKVSATFS